jgi:ATPase family AAA domain-containing protein 1
MSRHRENKGDGGMPWWKIAELSISAGVTIYLAYRSIEILTRTLDQMEGRGDKDKLSASKKALADRLGRPEMAELVLDSYESRLVSGVVAAKDIGVSFTDIGGMTSELEEVRDNVVLPMQVWKQFGSKASDMMSCPAGVLLYGKPGTGKTLTAMALASESGASFLNVKSADLMDKFIGESDKLVRALFSLARKIAPTIIFIDEIDTMIRKRENNTNEHIASLQGILLSEWDGLKDQNSRCSTAPVVILGATNRPMDLDPAILRRLPVQIKTKMPDLKARVDIFEKLLHKQLCDDGDGGVSSEVDLKDLAMRTEDYSGSDLREVVRVALSQRTKRSLTTALKLQQVKQQTYEQAMQRYESLKKKDKQNAILPSKPEAIVPKKAKLTIEDFAFALTKALSTGSAASEYQEEMMQEKVDEMRDMMDRLRGAGKSKGKGK